MKVIELLNKIANGEEVPKKIKIGNKTYNYETFNIGKGDNYFTTKWEEVKGYRISYDGTYYYLEIRDYNLNEEVEIIEENPTLNDIREKYGLSRIKDKKIEPLTTWYGVEPVRFEQPNTFKDNAKYIDYNTEMLFNKINEIIDYLEEIE